MTLDELLAVPGTRKLNASDIEAYCASSGLPIAAALDSVARAVARRYAAGSLGYTAGDAIANGLFFFATTKVATPDFVFPAFMESVFLAFDAGEFYPDDIRYRVLRSGLHAQ